MNYSFIPLQYCNIFSKKICQERNIKQNQSTLDSSNILKCPLLSNNIQKTLAISKSKRPSELLRDIRTLTYQICRVEENTNRKPNFTNKYVIRPIKLETYSKNIVKKRKMAPEEQILLLSIIFFFI